jgi:hypothetical protein
LVLRRLDRVHLLLDQQQPFALALDLGTHPRRKFLRMASPPALPQPAAHVLHPQIV